MENDQEDPLVPPELARPKISIWARALRTLAFTLIICGILFYFLLLPNFQRGKGPTLTPCKDNLKNVATALEMYASDNSGRYPKSLDQLVPKYLRVIPTCPATNTMTFTDYQSIQTPDAFTFSCVGDNHQKGYGKSARNYPRYSAEKGLMEPDR